MISQKKQHKDYFMLCLIKYVLFLIVVPATCSKHVGTQKRLGKFLECSKTPDWNDPQVRTFSGDCLRIYHMSPLYHQKDWEHQQKSSALRLMFQDVPTWLIFKWNDIIPEHGGAGNISQNDTSKNQHPGGEGGGRGVRARSHLWCHCRHTTSFPGTSPLAAHQEVQSQRGQVGDRVACSPDPSPQLKTCGTLWGPQWGLRPFQRVKLVFSFPKYLPSVTRKGDVTQWRSPIQN